ncbi:DoxX family protein [Streptomyces sp. NPDC050658]|uniref:DoxX family protein n=1 Tax=unclassified Streptomyces TaxID=2593676 RepID=UPI0034164552
MIDTPHHWWLTALLALVLFGDAVLSVRPPVFIQRCLDGVRLPRDWWWALIVTKLMAAAGLIAGLKYPGVAFAANAGVIGYFLCASYAHYRARFLKQEFWVNCLGMLGLSVGVLVACYAV